MDDNTIEIRDDEVDVESIMAKIRENIRHRQMTGEFPPDPEIFTGSSPCKGLTPQINESGQRDLSYVTTNWDIRNNSYFISSHRPYIGKILVKGRQVVHEEVRRYVDPMVFRQTEFNASTVRILSSIYQKCDELDLKISRQNEELHRRISLEEEKLSQRISLEKEELAQRISQDKEELILAIQTNIDTSVHEIFSKLNKTFLLQQGLVRIIDEQMQKGLIKKDGAAEQNTPAGLNYLLFEDRFRGSREDIRERQMVFLPYFEKSTLVLDIGCGRGEFLEILQNHNIGGIGIDLDSDMIAYCKSNQLNVEQGDAISYLEKLKDNSLDGIFVDQVMEHMEPAYIIRLLALCHQKLKSGYYMVVETVNPLSFVSFVNFYIDLSHKRPIHPDTLQYLMSIAGFKECEIKFFSPVSEEGRLKKITNISELDLVTRKNVDIYNHNTEILNTVLFGAQDYAVIGKK